MRTSHPLPISISIILALALCCFLPDSLSAQIPAGFVQTTATVPSLAGGSFGASWTNLSSSSQLSLLGGVSTFQTTVSGTLDANGKFSVLLADPGQVIPQPDTWSFTFTYSCPAGSPDSGFAIQLPMAVLAGFGGGTVDISSQVTAALPTNPCNGTVSALYLKLTGGTLTGPLMAPQINYVVIANIYSSVNAAAAACPGGGGCTIQVTGTVPLSGPITLPATTTLVFNQPGSINTAGYALTINGPIQAPATQIFTGSGVVTLGSLVTQPPVEWFGAVVNSSGAGVANQTAIQNCINAITSGNCYLSQAATYYLTGTITIAKSSVGIVGNTYGVTNNTLYSYNPTVMLETSASADAIYAYGTGIGTTIGFNQFKNFSIWRNVIPTGTAAGLHLSFTYGTQVDSVDSEDSIYDFWLHAVGGQGDGYIAYSTAVWGYNSVTETTGSLYGFFIDSADGISSNSLRIHDIGVFTTLSGPTTYGLAHIGKALNDLFVDNFETAGVGYGDYMSFTAGGSNHGTDVHIKRSINDGCLISCMFFQNVSGSIEVLGGWNYKGGSGSEAVIDLELSSNVHVSDAAVWNPVGTGIGLYVNGGGANQIIGNQFPATNGSAAPIQLQSTTANVISNNVMGSGSGSSSIAAINLLASSGNVVSSNSAAGTCLAVVKLDGTTTGSQGLDTNVSVGCTNQTVDLNGVSNYPYFVDGLQIGAGGDIRGSTTNLGISDDNSAGWNLSVGASAAFGDRFWKGGPGATLVGQIDASGVYHAPGGIVTGTNGTQYAIRQKVYVTGSPVCIAAANFPNDCPFTVTFPNAFPDSNWHLVCYVNGASAGQSSIFGQVNTNTTSAVAYFINMVAAPNSLTAASCEGWE